MSPAGFKGNKQALPQKICAACDGDLRRGKFFLHGEQRCFQDHLEQRAMMMRHLGHAAV